MNKKPLFSLRSSLLFSKKITANIFTRFISRFKIHSNKIDLKTDFSNTPFLVVKKDSAPIQFKFFECKKNRSAIIVDWEDQGGY